MMTALRLRREQDPKFVYYLSAEFLMGRSLTNTVANLGLVGPYADVRIVPVRMPMRMFAHRVKLP